MAKAIAQLLATDAARVKLGARDISTEEVAQLPRNRHATSRNSRGGGEEGERILLVGRTDGGRRLALVLERTPRPDILVDHHWMGVQRSRA